MSCSAVIVDAILSAGPGVAARYPDGLVNQGVSAELAAQRWELANATIIERL